MAFIAKMAEFATRRNSMKRCAIVAGPAIKERLAKMVSFYFKDILKNKFSLLVEKSVGYWCKV